MPKPCCLFAFSTLINNATMQLVIPSPQITASASQLSITAEMATAISCMFSTDLKIHHLLHSVFFSICPSRCLQLFQLPRPLLKDSDVNSMDSNSIHVENSSQYGQISLLCLISAYNFSCCMWSLHKGAFSYTRNFNTSIFNFCDQDLP